MLSNDELRLRKLVQEATVATTALRAETRLAHEVLVDVRATIKEAREVIDKVRAATPSAVEQEIETALEAHLTVLGERITEEMARSVKVVQGKFEQLTALLMGRTNRTPGSQDLEEMAREVAALSVAERDRAVAEALRPAPVAPLPPGLTDAPAGPRKGRGKRR